MRHTMLAAVIVSLGVASYSSASAKEPDIATIRRRCAARNFRLPAATRKNIRD
jgi:hypothetical protein